MTDQTDPEQLQQRIDQLEQQVADLTARKGQPSKQKFVRRQSRRRIFGVPLWSVAFGPDLQTGQAAHAKGIIAFGDVATGLVALGGLTTGIISIGGVSFGLFSVGGVCLGLCAGVGGVVVGGLVLGGVAVGLQAFGGVAINLIDPDKLPWHHWLGG